MTLMKATDYGLISVSNSVFAEIIHSVFSSETFRSTIWLSGYSGKLKRLSRSLADQEYARAISVHLNNHGRIVLSFGVVVKFGISIRQTTRVAADEICTRIYEQTGMIPEEITMNIEGVRTQKRTARRNTKVVYNYDENEWKNREGATADAGESDLKA